MEDNTTSEVPKTKLCDGYDMPLLGLGTWKLWEKECERAVREAIALGYRHIDTAEVYENQRAIGSVIRHVEREDLFITSKVPHARLGYDDVIASCEASLSELGTDYLDLLLIHWPNKEYPIEETARAFEALLEQGKVRSTGVSNFTKERLESMTREQLSLVAVNQVEFHPYLYQKELLETCDSFEIVLTAYCPLARGHVFSDPLLMEIAASHDAEVSQVCLAWLMQKGIAVVPKAASREHLQSNFESVRLELSGEDERRIDGLQKNLRLINPEWAEF